jgi:phosphatidylserine/phosphatidylglycerophosphate/cardiolipin synthase-like enzyme
MKSSGLLLRWAICLVVGAAVGCAPRPRNAFPASGAHELELVESSPVETALDHPDIPDAKNVWPAMIAAASQSIDFAEFYASNEPGSSLEGVIQAIEKAASRGVRVRFLSEKKFYQTYPETLDRLATRNGIEVRRYPGAELAGGVLHAKYFMVDGREAFVGSQNFDWRSLEHIQELGVRIRVQAVVGALADVFETDWALAGGAARDTRIRDHLRDYRFPAVARDGADAVLITPVFSPKGWLPEESLWDLPRLVQLIDSARRTVRVQLLTYRAREPDGTVLELESALRRAAARGARIELLVADWSKRKGVIEGLQRLQSPPAISVKLVTIPPWSGGLIPFARVVHAKYLVVDGEHSWIGTSNWERDYFERSRNVGLIVEGAAIGRRLDAFFADLWNSPYSSAVDPAARYEELRAGQ